MAYGKEKDDNENKGRKGKGPKKMKVKKESARKERKNLLTENPVVNRSDDNENIGRGGKGPKPMSRTGRAKASVMKLKDGLVNRFQSSTPKIGKNELMKPVIESLKATVVERGPVPKPMPGGLSEKIKPAPTMNYAKGSGTISSHTKTTVPVKKKVETKLTKGQKRSYELRDAHS
jgi:hypothetical protein